jgi:hypothetical protein
VSTLAEWYAARTAGAPERLVARARAFLDGAPGDLSSAVRLQRAGEAALDAAIAGGADRRAAIDLLAADALITLALLDVATARPGQLLDEARHLRLTAGMPR